MNGEKPRVLVADDDTWILRMVATVLERQGFTVETAHDGEEALAKAQKQKPDLVIADIMMPKVDGWTFVKALRAKPEFAFIPVIFLTALNSDDDRIRGFRLGADDYMTKPFRFEELDLRVHKIIQRSRLVERAAREQVTTSQSMSNSNATLTGRPVGLLGSLDQVGISGLLTLLELERKTGVLSIWNDRDPQRASSVAKLYLQEGRINKAEIEGRVHPKNSECIYHLLEWVSGRFEFTGGDIEYPDEMQQSVTSLLMEGARRIDERNAG